MKNRLPLPLFALIATVMCLTHAAALAKTARTYYTDADVAAIRARAKNPSYAREVRAILEKAELLTSRSDEELWDMVPEADLPRALNVRFGFDCPVHGKEVFKVGGHYPWIMSPDKPFKVQCPVGKEVYPSNDFHAYWKGGMKEKLDTKQKYVDDGNGWVDEEGNRYWFAAHYNFWGHWRRTILDGVTACGQAYLLTGDPKYAHTAAVVMARISQVYPAMDYRNQAYHSGKWPAGINGRILDYIWENSTAVNFATTYDAIYDTLDGDEKLRAIASARGVKDVKAAIEQDILQEQAGDVFEKKIWGNKLEVNTMSVLALVLDNDDPKKGKTTKESIEWVLRGPGELEFTLYNGFDRDGIGAESSPGYSSMWNVNAINAAENLARLGLDLGKEPKWRRVAKGVHELRILDDRTAHIGDHGGTIDGSPQLVRPDLLGFAVRQFDDADAARLLVRGREKAATRPSKNADATTAPATEEADVVEPLFSRQPFDAAKLKELAAKATLPDAPYTRDMGGYGLAILEANDGGPIGNRSAYVYYGSPAAGHGHLDRLNLGYTLLGRDVFSDLGYPSHWGPMSDWWVRNTPSHYCVMVDGRAQETKLAGHLTMFADLDGLKLAEAQANRTWKGGKVKDYRRLAALLDTGTPGSTLLIDAFVVEGGKQHDYSFHGLPFGKFAYDGKLVKEQAEGTLAGEDVAFDTKPKQNPEAGWQYFRSPKWYAASDVTKLTWRGDRGLDMDAYFPRFGDHSFDEVIVADTQPPVKPGYPDSMPYIVLRQTGEPTTLYLSVTDVYQGKTPVKSVERILANHPKAGGVVVTMENGDAWRVYVNQSGSTVKFGDGAEGDLPFAAVGPRKTYAVGGGKLGNANQPTVGPLKASEWTVTKVDYAKNAATVDGPALKPGKFGQVVMTDAGDVSASYTVRTADGGTLGFGETGLLTGRFAGAWDPARKVLKMTDRTGGVYNQFVGEGTFVGMYAVNEDYSTSAKITAYDAKANTFTIDAEHGEAFKDLNNDGHSFVFIADIGPGTKLRATPTAVMGP